MLQCFASASKPLCLVLALVLSYKNLKWLISNLRNIPRKEEEEEEEEEANDDDYGDDKRHLTWMMTNKDETVRKMRKWSSRSRYEWKHEKKWKRKRINEKKHVQGGQHKKEESGSHPTQNNSYPRTVPFIIHIHKSIQIPLAAITPPQNHFHLTTSLFVNQFQPLFVQSKIYLTWAYCHKS